MGPQIATATTTRPTSTSQSKISDVFVSGGGEERPNIIRTADSVTVPAGPSRATAVRELGHIIKAHSATTLVVSGAPALPGTTRDAIVQDCTQTLRELLAETDATFWLCNRDMPLRIHDIWHIADNISSPRVRLWVDVATLVARRETPSAFLKQLAQFTAAVAWRFESLLPLARGEELPAVSREIEILKGLAFRGLLVVDDAPEADDPRHALVDVIIEKLREIWCKPVVVLAAYKGDKHAPRFAAR